MEDDQEALMDQVMNVEKENTVLLQRVTESVQERDLLAKAIENLNCEMLEVKENAASGPSLPKKPTSDALAESEIQTLNNRVRISSVIIHMQMTLTVLRRHTILQFLFFCL